MSIENKRQRTFANKFHREIFLLLVLAALIPALIATVLLYYMIFSITADQLLVPEAIAYNLLPAAKKVLFILAFTVPLSILAILLIAHNITHKIVGPFDRIVRELEECAEGTKKDHIHIRMKDKFRPLVDKINRLLDKLHSP